MNPTRSQNRTVMTLRSSPVDTLCERRSAVQAEAGAFGVLRAAPGADDHGVECSDGLVRPDHGPSADWGSRERRRMADARRCVSGLRLLRPGMRGADHGRRSGARRWRREGHRSGGCLLGAHRRRLPVPPDRGNVRGRHRRSADRGRHGPQGPEGHHADRRLRAVPGRGLHGSSGVGGQGVLGPVREGDLRGPLPGRVAGPDPHGARHAHVRRPAHRRSRTRRCRRRSGTSSS